MKLYYHPRSPYAHKTLLALFEKEVAFTPVVVNFRDQAARAEYLKLNPLGKVPLLILDDGAKIPESTIIVEYLDTHFASGILLIPADGDLARQTRFYDRIADLYLKEPLIKLFLEGQKPDEARDAEAVSAAHQRLDTVFAALDQHLASQRWVMGDDFTLADCSLIPCLGLAQRVHPIDRWLHLGGYAGRASQRASVVRLQAELAPYLAQAAA